MRRIPCAIVITLVACGGGSSRQGATWVPEQAADLGAVVARVGDVPIYARQVEAQARQAKTTVSRALEDLVSLHLLAELSRAQGRSLPDWNTPELKSALAQRFLEREFEPSAREEDIPDSDLRPLYDKSIRSFVHSRLVDIGVLVVYTGALMKPEPREERHGFAKELAAFIGLQREHSAKTFEDIARQPSWSERHVGYLRLLQSDDYPLGRTIAAQIQKLKAPGDTTPLLEDETGYYICTYLGEQPAKHVTFEEAREELRSAYYARWREARFQQLRSRLALGHRVETHPELLNPTAR